MNSIPVMKSKLIMPELSVGFLLTERLKRLHTDMDACRAVTVCAPAGYGKTTLAVSYFNRRAAAPSRICWYRLDPEDRNLSVFITHLSEAVFPSEAPEFAESRRALRDYADMQLQPQQTIGMLCQEMWAYHSQNSNIRTYLVLDDFQNVGQVQDICDMTRYMFDNLPPSCTIFVLNRVSLSVFSERQKLEKKVVEIDMGDLVFSNTEIEGLILSMGHAVADRKLADAIGKQTEGWIAGIIILYQAVKGKSPGAVLIGAGKPDREDALFRYMSLEVLKSVESGTQNTLARLALLQDFSEAEASEIFEIDDIKSLIKQCLGFGIFIQRIPGDPVVYRFHSLFREFLLYILKDRYPGEQVTGLHLKAAEYYINHTAYSRAAGHLAKCGNSAPVLEMVTKVGVKMMMFGDDGQLKLWLDVLPDTMIGENPILLFYKALTMPQIRHREAEDVLLKLLQSPRLKDDMMMHFRAATALAYFHLLNNNMEGLVKALSSISRTSPGADRFGNTLALLDVIRSLGESEFRQGQAQIAAIRYPALEEEIQWLYLCYSCIIYYCLGRLDDAELCMKTASTLEHVKNIAYFKGHAAYFLATVLSLKNNKESLPQLLSEVMATGERYGFEYLLAYGRRLAAFEQYLVFNVRAAAELLDYAIYHFQRLDLRPMASATRLLKALWTFAHSEGAGPALEEARSEMAVIEKASVGMLVHEIALSILGAIARESGDFQLSEKCLLAAIEAAREKNGQQVLCGSCFHIARLYYAIGDAAQGRRYLEQAMDLAEDNRYFMFWDIHIPTVVEISLRSIRWGYRTGFAGELLGRFYDKDTVKYLAEKVKTLDESDIKAFTDGFAARYKADKREQLYFVKASLFGRPEISVNGVKIPDTEWKTKKVKGLLEYLIFSSGRTVSKETLSDILWPEADGKSGLVSLRTALYQLRKTLSKYNAEVSSNNAFIYETLEGLQIRNNEALEVDLHEFLRLYDEASGLPDHTSDADNRRGRILEKMISLYNGDLMEASDYGDLASLERDRCRAIFAEACLALSSIHIRRDERQKAEEILRRAFKAEPYDENICLELLRLYMSQGRKTKAVKLYYNFKKRLEQELDIKVDGRLAETIRDSKV